MKRRKMNSVPRGSNYNSLVNNLQADYIRLLPWKRRKKGDEELGLDDETLSETGSNRLLPTTPSAYSLSEGDLFFLRLGTDDRYSSSNLLENGGINQHLMISLEEKDLESVYYCFDNGADPNAKHGLYSVTPLQLATALGFIEAVDLLLQHGADVNASCSRGITPLHIAVGTGNETVFEKLINAGALVNVQDYPRADGTGRETPLHRAALGGHCEILLKLIKAGAQVNVVEERGRTPLHYAAQRGSPGCLKALLDYDANPNAQDYRGTTALLLLGGTFLLRGRGRLQGYTESVQILVRGGARANVRDPDTNVTPLHQAVTLTRIEAIKILISAGAEANAQDHEGITPLHISCLKGHSTAVKLLVTSCSQADINLADSQGRTALHKAAYRGSAVCIQILLNSGADLGAKTQSGTSALSLLLQLPTGPKILRQRLDAAITTNNVDPTEFDCRLKFDYSLLLTQYKREQMGIIEDILDVGRDRKVAELLEHPLIESFLVVKWRKIRLLFFSNVFFYLALVVGVTAYILSKIVNKSQANIVGNLQKSLCAIILVIIGQEIIQFTSLHAQYFREAESWIKLGALSTSTAIIFADSKDDWVIHCSAWAVFLGWTEVTLLLGRLPAFGVYALMFYTVAQQLVKFITVFFFFLAGFAFSFHIVFHERKAFQNPWTSLLRTVAMLVGDMDFDSFFYETGAQSDNGTTQPGNNTSIFPSSGLLMGTTHTLYFLFLILVALVLMNLLIGLAVNDIQGLQKEGRIKRLRKQAQFLVYLEDMAYSRLLTFFLSQIWREKVSKWIKQDTVLVVYPAVRKPIVRLPSSTLERALAIVQQGKLPVDQVTVGDLYNLVQEQSTVISNLKERIGELECYLKGSRATASTEKIASDGELPDQLTEDFHDSDFNASDSQEEVDEVDGQDSSERSLRSEINDIKNMLATLISTKND